MCTIFTFTLCLTSTGAPGPVVMVDDVHAEVVAVAVARAGS
jgi:hypothetical protein